MDTFDAGQNLTNGTATVVLTFTEAQQPTSSLTPAGRRAYKAVCAAKGLGAMLDTLTFRRSTVQVRVLPPHSDVAYEAAKASILGAL